MVDVSFQYDRWGEEESMLRGVVALGPDESGEYARRPLQVYVVVDVSEGLYGGMTQEISDAVTALVSTLSAEDQYALISYSGSVRTLMPFQSAAEPDTAALGQEIRGLSLERGRSYSTVFSRLKSLAENSSAGSDYRSCVIFFTHGSPDDRDLSASIDSMISYGGTAGLSFYTIGYGDDLADRELIRLAEETGGRAMYVEENSARDIGERIQVIGSEVVQPARYDIELTFSHELSFYAQDGSVYTAERYFINSIPEEGEKYIFFHIADDDLAGADLDITYEYFLATRGVERSGRHSERIPSRASSRNFDTYAAPKIILHSVLRNFLEQEATLLRSDVDFRRSFASAMGRSLLEPLEEATRQIATEEMQDVYTVIDDYANVLYGNPIDDDVELLFRQMKYKLHDCKFGY
ncbi:VWA domain-containing protein [Chitinivibrio alkaliphilus]|nr:VWA domain-containing protein [Chitinivibrio alkaliphilus]